MAWHYGDPNDERSRKQIHAIMNQASEEFDRTTPTLRKEAVDFQALLRAFGQLSAASRDFLLHPSEDNFGSVEVHIGEVNKELAKISEDQHNIKHFLDAIKREVRYEEILADHIRKHNIGVK